LKPVYFTFKGKTLSLSEWERETGISRCIISWRLRKKWKKKDILISTIRTADQIRKSNKASMKKALKTKLKNYTRKHTGKYLSKLYIKDRNLKRDFGINLGEYDIMLKEQNGLCKICKNPPASLNKSLGVDHCHKTGKVRGLLCDKCNRGLGLFGDNPVLLEIAKQYLYEHST
jgi:hypothetical protein